MLSIAYISTVLVSIGIASDNLMLAAMSGSLSSTVKRQKLLLILFMLLTIQMQAFLYGSWLAKFFIAHVNGLGKWIALSVLITTVLRMLHEFRLAQSWKNDIPYGFDGFLSIALATSIYVFVLGFSLYTLQISYSIAFPISMIAQAIMLLIGWYSGEKDWLTTLAFIKKVSLVLMVIGIALFFSKK